MSSFPLSERDAKLIEAAATQTPFDKGTEIVVGTTVSDAFEVNPDKVSSKNPAWIKFLYIVTKKVADGWVYLGALGPRLGLNCASYFTRPVLSESIPLYASDSFSNYSSVFYSIRVRTISRRSTSTSDRPVV